MNDQNINEKEPSTDESSDNSKDTSGDGEFKITVRKLEMPVRPRGVLAE
jgi:hypothetical protein